MPRKAHYNKTGTCDECKVNKLIPHKAKREIKNGKWTGRWLCLICHSLIMNYGTIDKNIIALIRSDYQYEKAKKLRDNMKYNDKNLCDECNKEKLTIGHARREYINGTETGRWLCISCYGKIREKDPNSKSNLLKSVADSRTGNLNPICSKAKGDKFQLLTKFWRTTISTIPIEDSYYGF